MHSKKMLRELGIQNTLFPSQITGRAIGKSSQSMQAVSRFLTIWQVKRSSPTIQPKIPFAGINSGPLPSAKHFNHLRNCKSLDGEKMNCAKTMRMSCSLRLSAFSA